jgi:ribonuclease P protein component
MLVSVPKRQFKLATDRNRIRRQCKDVYRRVVRQALQPAVDTSGQDLHLALIYTGGATKITPQELEKKLTGALQRLAKEIAPPHEGNASPVA